MKINIYILSFFLLSTSCVKNQNQNNSQIQPIPPIPTPQRIGTTFSKVDQLISDVHIDKSGNLIASLYASVYGFNSNGLRLYAINLYCNPCAAISVDQNGITYVADYWNGRIGKFSGNTLLNSSFFKVRTPNGIFVDNKGNVFISSSEERKIYKLDSSGNVIMQIGSQLPGSTDEERMYPEDVFVDKNGYIYVADMNRNRVQKWSPDGKTVITIVGGTTGNAANKVYHPIGVYVDNDGNVYICENGGNRVQKWAPGALSGVTVAGGNGKGSALNQLSNPSDIWLDASGNIYIADSENLRIQKWPPL